MFKRAGLMVVLCAGVCAAQEGMLTPPEIHSAIAELDGRVVSVDVSKSQLNVKDTQDQRVTIQVGSATTISSPVSSKLVLKNLKSGDKVHIYYMTADRTARQIDVTPVAPVLHDLETH